MNEEVTQFDKYKVQELEQQHEELEQEELKKKKKPKADQTPDQGSIVSSVGSLSSHSASVSVSASLSSSVSGASEESLGSSSFVSSFSLSSGEPQPMMQMLRMHKKGSQPGQDKDHVENQDLTSGFIVNIVHDLLLSLTILEIQVKNKKRNFIVTDKTKIFTGSAQGDSSDLSDGQTVHFKADHQNNLEIVHITGGSIEGTVVANEGGFVELDSKKKSLS